MIIVLQSIVPCTAAPQQCRTQHGISHVCLFVFSFCFLVKARASPPGHVVIMSNNTCLPGLEQDWYVVRCTCTCTSISEARHVQVDVMPTSRVQPARVLVRFRRGCENARPRPGPPERTRAPQLPPLLLFLFVAALNKKIGYT